MYKECGIDGGLGLRGVVCYHSEHRIHLRCSMWSDGAGGGRVSYDITHEVPFLIKRSVIHSAKTTNVCHTLKVPPGGENNRLRARQH